MFLVARPTSRIYPSCGLTEPGTFPDHGTTINQPSGRHEGTQTLMKDSYGDIDMTWCTHPVAEIDQK